MVFHNKPSTYSEVHFNSALNSYIREASHVSTMNKTLESGPMLIGRHCLSAADGPEKIQLPGTPIFPRIGDK